MRIIQRKFVCYQIYKYRKNEIIFTSQKQIFVVDILEMQIIKIIKPFETEEDFMIYNSYYLNNEYFFIFLKIDSSYFSKNLVIYKLKRNMII